MNLRPFFFLVLLAGSLLAGGCVRIATAPLRAERDKRAEAAFERLARVSPEKMAAWLNQRMTAKLELTPDQQPKVGDINLKYARQLHALALSTDSVRMKVRALRRQNSAKVDELKNILTPGQFRDFEEMKEDLRQMAEEARQEKSTQPVR